METVKEKSSENLHFSRTFIKVEGVNCSMTDVEGFTLVWCQTTTNNQVWVAYIKQLSE